MIKSFVFVNQYGSTPQTGYGGRYFYIARELAKNHEVSMISVSNHHLIRDPVKFSGLYHQAMVDGIYITWIKLLPYSSPRSFIRVANWFLFALIFPIFLARKSIDQLHYTSPSPVGFLGAFFSARLKRVKLVFDIRDVWPETLVCLGGISKAHPLVVFFGWLERFAYRSADRLTSNLPNFDVRLRELGIDTGKFEWVPNGVLLEEADLSRINSDYLFPTTLRSKKIVCYTGALGEANALKVLLEAAVQLKDSEDIKFVFIGDGGQRSHLEGFVNLNKLQNCFFLGSVPKKDIYKVQALSNILCIGALDSPLYRYGVAANKLFEYIYSNTPVIYYVNTPNYSPVSDAKCGIEVRGANGSDLAAAILKILDKPERYSGGAGSKYVRKLHSYAKIAEKIEGLGFS